MHSMKVAIQHTGLIGHKEAAAPPKTKASKDGSAHPHQGSHAQVKCHANIYLRIQECFF